VLIFSVGGYFMSETFSLGEEQPASKPVAMMKREILFPMKDLFKILQSERKRNKHSKLSKKSLKILTNSFSISL
jgi:hypothetical protein